MSLFRLVREMWKNLRPFQARPSRRRSTSLLLTSPLEQRVLLIAFSEFIDPNPAPGNQFGRTVVPLSTGNVVITSPFDDAGGADAGAVYLFNGATGELISTLTGSHANDRVGYGNHGVVTELANGNFVVSSPLWDNGGVVDAGAVTWGSGTTGVSGTVSALNSLTGSSAQDMVGAHGVTPLSNGNYVVSSRYWDNEGAVDAGAFTWASGTSGIVGSVNALNSLVGTTANDSEYGHVDVLNNGNYLVVLHGWDKGVIVDAGAVAWANGTTGISGPVSVANSLVGSTAGDYVGSSGVITLSNGNYVVGSPNWDNGSVTNVGAATWGNGATGITGVVSPLNSLIGGSSDDRVSSGYSEALSNGNYVIGSMYWNNGTAVRAGAATWGNGATGTTGVVSSLNSLVGSHSDDKVGGLVTVLSNGNYVIHSAYWDNGDIIDAGAVTWGSGTTGVSGPVSSTNSLVGDKNDDKVGLGAITALSNGNYVVRSQLWDNGLARNAGAVTWGNGSTGITGVVSPLNSLVGSRTDDYVGDEVIALSNGNFVVRSTYWNHGTTARAGAVTWGNGSTGITGAVSILNSLVGSSSYEHDYYGGVTALSNGNYVIWSPGWDNGNLEDAGAVTWANGTTGISGLATPFNSLVGTHEFDEVGSNRVIEVGDGNYIVGSPYWQNEEALYAGAVTWGNGTTGISGEVSVANSLVGVSADDYVGDLYFATGLNNGNYLIATSHWDNGNLEDAGAVTWGSGTTGIYGGVSSSNSLVGFASNTFLDLIVVDSVNGTFICSFLDEGGGRVRVGSQSGPVPESVSWALDGSALNVQGTSSRDTITVLNDGGFIKINANGVMIDTGTSSASVTSVTVSGLGEDDMLKLDPSLGALVVGTLLGGYGNDTLISGLGNDTLDGGADVDTVSYIQATTGVRVSLALATVQTTVGAGKDKLLAVENLTGSGWNDTLTGNGGNNVLAGGLGNDTLNGGLGADSLYGEGGNDSLTIDGSDLFVSGGQGNDKVTVASGSGSVVLDLTVGQIETVVATASNTWNLFDATGATWVVSITGGNGDDTIIGGTLGDKLIGGGGFDEIYGGEGNDSINGGLLSDILYGQGGNDTINGDAGIDFLYGGMGDDSLTIDGDDENVTGDEGNDKVTVAAGSGDVTLFLANGAIETVVATASTANNFFSALGATWSVSITGGSGDDLIIGGDAADKLTGGRGDDSFYGGEGNDSLNGDDGDDWIFGGDGNDSLNGGLGADKLYGEADNDSLTIDGDDTYVVGGEGFDKVTVAAGSGAVNLILGPNSIESVVATASTADNAFAAGDATFAVSIIGGSGNDSITGGNFNDTLSGGMGDDFILGAKGNDIINGGLGADQLYGNEGNDSLTIDNLDTVIYGDEGLDKVTVSVATGGVTLDLTVGRIETVLATASTFANTFDATGATWAVSITGGSGNDTIIGGNLNDMLTGGAGDDSISGGEGNDALTGGLGADKLFGDGGNDALRFDNLDTSVIGGAGLDTATVTAPTGAVSLNLFTGEIETVSATASTFHNLFDATGATWNVAITGGSGNDTLRGGLMNDKLTGGAGNDLLIGGDGNDTLTGGDGIDTISYETATGPVTVNLTTKNATGAAGNDTLATIENVIGSPFNDTITGDLLSNLLDGGDAMLGNDTILGGGGADSIINA